MTLLTALIFMALISLTVAAVSSIVSQKGDISERFKIRDARSVVLNSALRNARTATFYYSTLLSLSPGPPVSDPFFQCMIDDGSTDCQAGVVHPFKLLDSTDPSTPPLLVLDGVSNPVHYNIYGQVCASPSRNLCVFDVSADFKPSCEGNISPCKQASAITVTVYVSVNPSFQSSLSYLNTRSSSELVAIADLVHSFTPVLPPVVPANGGGGEYGAPLGYGAGPTGGITNTWLIEKGLITPSAAPAGGGGPPPSLPALSSCPPGRVMSGQGCVEFSF